MTITNTYKFLISRDKPIPIYYRLNCNLSQKL